MRFVLVLNKRVPLLSQMNACGHLSIGMARQVGEAEQMLRRFDDMTGQQVSLLTDHPLIVMAARSSAHLRQSHEMAIREGVPCNAFFSCMHDGQPVEQELILRNTAPDQLDYVALGLFGERNQLADITKRFSLYRFSDNTGNGDAQAGGNHAT